MAAVCSSTTSKPTLHDASVRFKPAARVRLCEQTVQASGGGALTRPRCERVQAFSLRDPAVKGWKGLRSLLIFKKRRAAREHQEAPGSARKRHRAPGLNSSDGHTAGRYWPGNQHQGHQVSLLRGSELVQGSTCRHYSVLS